MRTGDQVTVTIEGVSATGTFVAGIENQRCVIRLDGTGQAVTVPKDHVVLNAPVNIDVEPDGTIRLMSWGGHGGWVDDHPSFHASSAMFHAADVDKAIASMEVDRQIREKVERQVYGEEGEK